MNLCVLSLSTRTPILTTCGEHQAWQSPGEVCQLRRFRTACGRLPWSSLCQASSWIPEVCSTTACRTLELCEERHLLPSYVSRWGGPGPCSTETSVIERYKRGSFTGPIDSWSPQSTLETLQTFHCFLDSSVHHPL